MLRGRGGRRRGPIPNGPARRRGLYHGVRARATLCAREPSAATVAGHGARMTLADSSFAP